MSFVPSLPDLIWSIWHTSSAIAGLPVQIGGWIGDWQHLPSRDQTFSRVTFQISLGWRLRGISCVDHSQISHSESTIADPPPITEADQLPSVFDCQLHFFAGHDDLIP
jgi:hypothetical protein